MSNKYLATYLNDHLAGSVTVLELLSHLEAAYAGTETTRFAAELRGEIAADRAELEGLMARLQIAQRPSRKAAAWIAEKAAQVKLSFDDGAGGPLHLLEAMEAISIGIEGKRLLWLALDAVATAPPGLGGCDYQRLIQRAEDQRRRVESVRVTAARRALSHADTGE